MIITKAFSILTTIVLPIFVLIGIGVALDRKFRLDLPTLSKIYFNVFTPALLFVNVYESDIDFADMWRIALFTALHFFAMSSRVSLRCSFGLRSFGKKTLLTLATAFFNAGNYGLPLAAMGVSGDGRRRPRRQHRGRDPVCPGFPQFLPRHLVSGTGEAAGPLGAAGPFRPPVINAILAALLLKALGWADHSSSNRSPISPTA